MQIKLFNKNKILAVLLIVVVQTTAKAQSIKQKDKYGQSIAYVDGLTLKSKNKYGKALYYIDGQTIKLKDKYGKPLYFIDGNTVHIKDKYG